MKRDAREGPSQFVLEAVEDAMGPNDALASELDRAARALASALLPQKPSTIARGRLLAEATNGPMRYAPFFDRLSQMFDLARDGVVAFLERSATESEWEPGPHPSIRVLNFQGGPAVAGADTGLVRMPPDFVWPRHRHGGVERALILEGGYVEGGGRVYRAGDLHEMAKDSEHSFTVLPGEQLLLAVTLFGEIEIL